MSRPTHYQPAAIPALCAALLFGASACAETETRSFDVSPGDHLLLDTDWGEVAVTTHDDATVEVSVENADKLELDYEQEDDALTIRGRRKDAGVVDRLLDWRNRPAFHLSVPREHDLTLRTAGGPIAVDDLDGTLAARTSGGGIATGEIADAVHVETSGGAIQVSAAGGTVTATTSGGSITLGRVDGAVEARTSGGGIQVEAATGQVVARTSGGSIRVGAGSRIEARTSGGSIRAALHAPPDGDSLLRTSGGDIEVRVAPGIGLNIDAKTSGGRVVADLPVTVRGAMENSALRGTAGGGGPELRLRTAGGSIRIQAL